MNNYSSKLKDPRWQKKRLEILQRDNFTCRLCNSTEDTLMIHHLKYGINPWDVDSIFLLTLCERCHQQEHNDRYTLEKRLIKSLKHKGFTIDHLGWIGAIIDHSKFTPDEIILVISACLFNKKIDDTLLKHYLTPFYAVMNDEENNGYAIRMNKIYENKFKGNNHGPNN